MPRVRWRGECRKRNGRPDRHVQRATNKVSEATHVAHFYGEVEGHVDYVAGYLADALLSGTGALIVARPPVTERLQAAIAAWGVDIGQVSGSGLLTVLDAEMLLSQIQDGTV